jgi:glutamine amidotransferase
MGSVVLVDSGGTNIGSVSYALGRLGVEATLTTDPSVIRAASHVVLPGVGAAAPAMEKLRELGLVEVIRGLRQPVLGVCLGMQLLCEHSAEGDTACLGVIPGRVVRLAPSPHLRVPHMGWNTLDLVRSHRPHRPHPVLARIAGGEAVYFVHGYALPVQGETLAATTHGGSFSAIVARDNFVGMQFHPERSAAVGARLLESFLAS